MSLAKSCDWIHVQTRVVVILNNSPLLLHMTCQASVNFDLVNVFAYGFHIKRAERE